ncbi:alpha-amylase family glycosyl hydrolase [Micromonospora chalcea]
MEYLHWLGVDTIWLSPVFASPFRDAGLQHQRLPAHSPPVRNGRGPG